jgi:hypothetical protein
MCWWLFLRILGCFRVTGNPEVIASAVGLVPTTRIPSVLDFLTRCRLPGANPANFPNPVSELTSERPTNSELCHMATQFMANGGEPGVNEILIIRHKRRELTSSGSFWRTGQNGLKRLELSRSREDRASPVKAAWQPCGSHQQILGFLRPEGL